MILSDEVGQILSPTIKIILFVVISLLAFKLFQKYLTRRTQIALILCLMLICFDLAVLFSAFNNLLNWQNFFQPNSFFGMNLAFFVSAWAFTAYDWVIIEVFFGKNGWTPRNRVMFIINASIMIFFSGLAGLLYTSDKTFDSFYLEYTIYSLIGWAFVSIGAYFTYKSYV
jgi:hypothetical protein